MWLFTTIGFYSIVRSSLEPDHFQIRARKREHLVNLQEHMEYQFGRGCLGNIIACPDADYRWRLIVNQPRLETTLGELLAMVDYTNFKSAVHKQLPADAAYHATLIPVWREMLVMQHLAERQEVTRG